MKLKQYILIIVICIVCFNCSKEEFEYLPSEIEFVYLDGSAIPLGECIDPLSNYAISLSVRTNGIGEFPVTKLLYSFNGALQSTTFLREETKLIPVVFRDGENVAQLFEEGFECRINFVTQGEFELVE